MIALVLAMLLQQPPPSAPPQDAAAAVARARALIDEGKPLVAVESLQPFRAAGDPDVELAAGVAYYHAGDAVRAVEALAPVVSRLPAGSLGRREAVQVLGLANYLAGRIGDAIPYLEQTRAFAPGTRSWPTRWAWPTSRRGSRTSIRSCAADNLVERVLIDGDADVGLQARHVLREQIFGQRPLQYFR